MIFYRIHTTLFLSAFLAVSALAFVGDWRSMTYLDSVNCLAAFEEQLFVGTTGGIRVIQPQDLQERIYNNPSEGIKDVRIMGFATSSDNYLWAVSRSGIIYKYSSSGNWRTFDRGYAALGWHVNLRAVVSVGNFLLLGTEKGLSFFNRHSGRVDFNLDMIGKKQTTSVTALLVRDPFLYLSTTDGIYRAKIYWKAPDNPPQGDYLDISSPQIWEMMDTTTTARHLFWESDSLKYLPWGSTIEKPLAIQVMPNQPLIIQNQKYGIRADIHAVAVVGNRIFMGGNGGLFYLGIGKLEPVRSSEGLPPGIVANVRSSPFGTYIWVLNMVLPFWPSKLFRLEDKKWNEISGFEIPQGIEPITERLNSLNISGDGAFYVGNWGRGIMIYKNNVKDSLLSSNSCIESIPGLRDYTAIHATEPYRDKGFLSTIYQKSLPYSLAYLDYESGDLTCYPAADLISNAIDVSNLTFSGDSLLIISTELGIDVYSVRENNNRLRISPLKKVNSPESQDKEMISAEVDSYGRLWAVTGSQAYYAENFLVNKAGEDSLNPASEFNSNECHNIIRDQEGSLWLGCANGLFRVTPGEKKPVEKVVKLGNKDGLLSENIIHMDLDNRTGYLWIVSDKGVNLYESSGRKVNQKLDNALVYPNPFKPQHRFVVFDNLTSDSEVRIFSQAGSPVFRAAEDLIQGGQLKWYGENQSGRPVKAGIYFYAIKTGNQWKRGKLIVAR